jgi:hypothetical protein
VNRRLVVAREPSEGERRCPRSRQANLRTLIVVGVDRWIERYRGKTKQKKRVLCRKEPYTEVEDED